MATWQDQLKATVGQRGYENCMRRSLQSVVLYEAKRCLVNRFAEMRPYQRKAAFLDQAVALLESLDFLYPHQRAEVMWRTATSKDMMDAEIAWKRIKGIEKELLELSKKMEPFVVRAKTHEDACNQLVQHLYESVTGFSGKPYPLNWEHAHNHVIFAYRLYYRYDRLDENFPPAISPREVNIPSERPRAAKTAPNSKIAAGGDDEPHLDVAELLGEKAAVDERRKVLQEVREHLDLLKEFEGVISDEELAKRKRDLFSSLPPAPTPLPASPAPNTAKKMKRDI